MSNYNYWNKVFADKAQNIASQSDSAHDFLHFQRVVKTALEIAREEGAKLEVVLPASWLHDIVYVAKDSPDRKLASQYSAEEAINFLIEIDYPKEYFDEIYHAIHSHSYSAGIEAKTLEAQIVQDADRLDALGAIGIARCFAVGGSLNRSLYSHMDLLCEQREPDDSTYTTDHFYNKLFKLPEKLNTRAAKAMAQERVMFMRQYLEQLKNEVIAT